MYENAASTPSHVTSGPARRPGLRPSVSRATPARIGLLGIGPPGIALPAIAVAIVVAIPLAYIFLRSASGGMAEYLGLVFSLTTARLLVNTLLLVAGVLALSLAIAVPMAWLVARTDLPGRRVWAVLGALPLVFPSYVAAFTLVAALKPKGYLQGWLADFGVERLPPIVYGYSGALLALGLFTYPYTYLLLTAALRGLDPAYEESSRALGTGRWRTFLTVVLPQLRPALYGGSLLVVLYTLSDFGAVSIVRYNTFTLSIYTAYQGLFDRTAAASLASVLVLVSAGFIALEARLVRRARPSLTRPGRPAVPVALGAWRWPSLAFLTLVALVAVGIPLAVVATWGLRSLATGALASSGSAALGASLGAAANSLTVAALAAAGATLAALPVAAWAVRHGSPLSKVVERISSAGFALPGLVIALSLVFFASRFTPWLYQTAGILVLAYIVRFLPEALAAARSALRNVAPVFEEAAQSLGRGPWSILRTLTIPLIRPGLWAGAGLVFLTSMKELPATLLLRPIGFETLATRVWSAASESIYSEASLPALILVVVSIPPVYVLIIRPALAERAR